WARLPIVAIITPNRAAASAAAPQALGCGNAARLERTRTGRDLVAGCDGSGDQQGRRFLLIAQPGDQRRRLVMACRSDRTADVPIMLRQAGLGGDGEIVAL